MSTASTTWHHIRRSPFQSLGAIIMMTISFFVFTAFFVITNGMSQVLSYFENKPEITIFLKDGLDKDTVENVQKELAAYPNIKEIKFISKDKALAIYREQNKDNPLLLEMVSASILPASFEVSAYEPKVLQDIANNFGNRKDVVDEIVYQKDVIDSLLNWTSTIRKVGLVTLAVLGSVSFLFIFTVITMKITGRKDEIKISRLLGASGWYTSRPFLLEGVFYGLIGVILGSSFCLAAFYFTRNSINQFFNPVTFLTLNPIFYAKAIGIELLSGIFLGLFASWVGVSRLIKF
ncbi:ABC transporter permease [Patescibacteria group bacterium]|nr:ABC transporter permease [Patescibacteria group bacterium]